MVAPRSPSVRGISERACESSPRDSRRNQGHENIRSCRGSASISPLSPSDRAPSTVDAEEVARELLTPLEDALQ